MKLKMDEYADVKCIPLAALPVRTRRLLTCLMDTPKIIPSDGPVKLPRDWRGLAYRVNISAELAANIQQFEDKTGRVLDIWLQDPSMTVGHLLEQLALLDRFDVIDDICTDLRDIISKGEPLPNKHNQLYWIEDNTSPADAEQGEETKIITLKDAPGYEHQYHAFVLHASEDQEFVDELVERLEADGFEICTVNQLVAGHITQYKPVAKLISERCKRIILVYSPDFLTSPSNKFYSTFAQAVSIESKKESKIKIIPIMYRQCQLPHHLNFYYRLHYDNMETRALYDFWQRLRQTLAPIQPQPRINARPLNIPRMNINVPMINAQPSTHSPLRISEMSMNPEVASYMKQELFVQEPDQTTNELDSLTSNNSTSLSNISQTSGTSDVRKKKKNTISRMFNSLKGKNKNKKAIMVGE